MVPNTFFTLLVAGARFWSTVAAKSVFAHYMVGSTDPDHAMTDVQDAIAVNLDAFAMNVGAPSADWAKSCVQSLFDAVEGTGFSLFFSFDMLQDSNLSDHIGLFDQYKDHPNYFKAGPQNLPLVSSYGGYNQRDAWAQFKGDSNIFLMPNLDDPYAGQGDTSPYYTDPSGQLSDFNSIVDGYFSWEASWPASTGGPANVSSDGDQSVMTFAHGNNKSYMMGLSTLQYKNMGENHWYRIGEVNFAQRMAEILDLEPEFTEVITWNDAGESHYIGNIWEESLDPVILQYANDNTWPHKGWQSLVTSFIEAFKNGRSAREMTPPSNNPIGALWYRGMLSDACADPPRNYESAVDTLNYAIVLPASSEGFKIRVSIDNNILAEDTAESGLNYASVSGLAKGTPRLDVVGSDGYVHWSAVGVNPVEDGGVECNFNFNVVGLIPAS